MERWKGRRQTGQIVEAQEMIWLAFMRLLGHVIALGIPKRKVVWRQQCQPGSPSLYLIPCSQRAAWISHNCSPLTLNSTFSEPVLYISTRSIQVEIDSRLLLPLGPFPFRKALCGRTNCLVLNYLQVSSGKSVPWEGLCILFKALQQVTCPQLQSVVSLSPFTLLVSCPLSLAA